MLAALKQMHLHRYAQPTQGVKHHQTVLHFYCRIVYGMQQKRGRGVGTGAIFQRVMANLFRGWRVTN